MHYFNSRGNYPKVNGFARIYTLPAGRRTWPRRDREGRGQLEWAALISMACLGDLRADHRQGFVSHCQSWRFRSLCAQRGGGSLCSLSWSAAGLGELLPSVYSRDLTHNPESPRISALYYWKMCSRVFLRGLSLQTPSPLTVSSLLPESVKDSQDLDMNRQVVAERETLCNQKTVQKSQFCFWGRNQPAEWLRNAVAIQAIEWSTTKQRRGDSQLSVWADLQMLLEHSSGGVNGSQPRETNKIFLIGRKIGELGFPDKAKACFQLS